MTEVTVRIGEDRYTSRVEARDHRLLADEPVEDGGADQGPTPYELLAAALGSCTAITLRMYADRKGWPVRGIDVRVRHEKVHRDDCENCDDPKSKIDRFERSLSFSGPLDQEQVRRLAQIASHCPVHRTLAGGNIEIVDEVTLVP